MGYNALTLLFTGFTIIYAGWPCGKRSTGSAGILAGPEALASGTYFHEIPEYRFKIYSLQPGINPEISDGM